MCGISGFLSSSKDTFLGPKVIKSMTSSLRHRGPDNENNWINYEEAIALGHNRLSIIDLTNNGNQPMISSSGRYVISFNGEVYNHLDLREELKEKKKINWKSKSDTETILEMFDYYGINESLKKFNGMFAIAIWDNKTKYLSLVRDRFGEKPLFFGWTSNSIIFSSELKAIVNSINFKKEINLNAVSAFMRLSYIPSPMSIYQNIYKLGSGEKLELNKKGISECYMQDINTESKFLNIKVSRWWEPIKSKQNENFYSKDLENQIHLKIEQSVKRQMISDVKNGVFLSGGVDSSLITALYQKNSIKKIKSFTIGSSHNQMDESRSAKKIADYLGTEHHEIIVNPSDQINLIEKLPEIYDEPFADSSQIPSLLINKFASDHVKVALTGDGGDEIFCGYNRYIYSHQIWKLIQILRRYKINGFGKILNKIPKQSLINLEKIINIFNKGDSGFSLLDEKIKKISDAIIYSTNLNELFLTHINSWQVNQNIILNEELNFLPKKFYFNSENEHEYILDMQLTDLNTYLPDDILCKSDRASMFSSLENRSPFLDHEIYDLAKSLPHQMKINNKKGKYVLKNILSNYIPEKLFNRPKKGFSIPVGEWLKNELNVWANELLDENNLKKYNFLNSNLIINYWNIHKSNSHDHSKKIWNVIMLLSWLKKNGI